MPTPEQLWREYLKQNKTLSLSQDGYISWHFCDNQECADKLIELVLDGKKLATASAVWTYELTGEALPVKDEISILTNWDGDARCIIRNTAIKIVPFEKVDPEFAKLEGEGDGSLEFWRKTHWEYFTGELAKYGKIPRQDMPIVCQVFEVLFKSGR